MKRKSIYSVYGHALVTAVLAVTFVGCASLMHKDEKSSMGAYGPDIYIQGKDKHKVVIAVDQVGIILQEKAAARAERTIDTIEKYNLKFRARTAANHLIFHVPEASSREQIVFLARALRLLEPDTIRTAGIVLRFRNGESPVIVTDDIVTQYSKSASPQRIEALHENIGIKVLEANTQTPNRYLVRIMTGNKRDPLVIANDLNQHPLVEYAGQTAGVR